MAKETYNRRDSQMVTHSSTSRLVQCLCMAERTECYLVGFHSTFKRECGATPIPRPLDLRQTFLKPDYIFLAPLTSCYVT